MNEAWWWLVILAFLAGAPIWFWVGIYHERRNQEIKFEEWRQAQIRIKKTQLARNGRRLPAREGAGPPIVQRRVTFRRNPNYRK